MHKIVAMKGGIRLGTVKSRVMRDRLQYLKRKKEVHLNLSAKDLGRGRRWEGVFLLGGVGEIQRRSVLKRMWDKRREKGRKVEEEYLSNSLLAFVFTISLFISSFSSSDHTWFMCECLKGVRHLSMDILSGRSGLMTLVVGLLHRATFLSNLTLDLCVSFSYMNLVVGKDIYQILNMIIVIIMKME